MELIWHLSLLYYTLSVTLCFVNAALRDESVTWYDVLLFVTIGGALGTPFFFWFLGSARLQRQGNERPDIEISNRQLNITPTVFVNGESVPVKVKYVGSAFIVKDVYGHGVVGGHGESINDAKMNFALAYQERIWRLEQQVKQMKEPPIHE